MSLATPEALRVARSLIDEHAAEADSNLAAKLEAVVARLHLRLDSWIGTDGCTRLLHRALTLTAARHPILVVAAVRSDPPHLGGIDRFGRYAADSPDAALAAAHDFMGVVFEHLCLFVGHDVAVRLVLPDSPELWRPAGPDEGPENDR